MPKVKANGIELEYESIGDPKNPTILLVMGLGAQLTLWPDDLFAGLAARGFRVVRFDNRDVGLSSDFESWGTADLPTAVMKVMSGQKVEAPYTLSDMAKDAVGLLDALGVDKAHVVGASMGGMIAQIVAGKHSERTRSLVSIMSTTGRPGLPPGKPEAMQALVQRPPAASDREALVQFSMKLRRTIGSPAYQESDADLRRLVLRNIERRYFPSGVGRQYLAILASGHRVDLLKTVTKPTLVIHGADDPLVHVEGGRDTAKLVAGAELEIYPGMGHDLPAALVPAHVDRIARFCARF